MQQYLLQAISQAARLYPFNAPTTQAEAVAKASSFTGIRVYTPAEAQRKGIFGLPIFMPVEFHAPPGSPIGSNLLLDMCIVTVSRQRHITTTLVPGRDGAVRELWANGDYSVDIQGIFASSGAADGSALQAGADAFPLAAAELLDAYASHKGSLRVEHDLLTTLGIYDVAILEHSIQMEQGRENVATYSIKCEQDVPVKLQLRRERRGDARP